MIRAQELRIGNIARVANLTGTVTCIDIESDEVSMSFSPGYGYLFQDLQPIPLTTEWLERMGFMEESFFRGVYFLNDFSIRIVDYQPVVLGLDEFVEFGNPLQYIHQLQNLYFALCGEELQIKDHVKGE